MIGLDSYLLADFHGVIGLFLGGGVELGVVGASETTTTARTTLGA
jgi:hypothetical protein